MIILNNISFKYKENFVLESCSAEFKTPGVSIIVGDNCSGKSTLMDIMSTFKEPTLGSVSVLGVNPFASGKALDTVRSLLSYMPSSFSFPHRFKVFDILKMRRNICIPSDVLEFFSINKYMNKRYIELSDGMKTRLNIVMAFCSSNIVFLDEPLRSQDDKLHEIFPDFINEFSLGKTIIISSPVSLKNIENAESYFLSNGRLLKHD